MSQSDNRDTVADVGTPVRQLRLARKESQFKLGARARVSSTIISAAENGRLRLGPHQLKRLARALGVDVAVLLKVLRDMKKRGNLNRRPPQLSEAGREGFRLASATRRR